jgi:penicillin-binding protein 1B
VALRVALGVLLTASAVAASWLVRQYNAAALAVDERLASGYLTSRAGIYAAPRVLRAGQKLSRERLIESLRAAGYVESNASRVWSGAFTVADGAVEIRPRASGDELAEEDSSATRTSDDDTGHAEEAGVDEESGAEASGAGEESDAGGAGGFAPKVVRVSFDARGRVGSVTGDGAALDSFALEPEPLTTDGATKTGRREELSFADIPPALAHAVLAIEDRRFFEHGGVDLQSVARALVSWAGPQDGGAAARQGGSTVTQQLVKNTYLTPERTLRRKFREALLAFALERRLSKQDIFALYCNEVYLGQRGAAAVRGVRQAARAYFGKELKDLTLAESATIAGMIQSPARYAPDRRPEDARARRNAVLAAMAREQFITREEAESAAAEAVGVAPQSGAAAAVAPHFVDYVNRAVEARLDEQGEATGRQLRVHTTIDLDLQRLAEEAVARQLSKLDASRGRRAGRKGAGGGRRVEAALVALDARTGAVLAMVGGRDYASSQLNRAADARRQPGSVFKPFVYAAAVEGGISPAAVFPDAPRGFEFDAYAPAYRPANYGGAYSMRDVTMRSALTRSLNVVTVDVALRAGLERVARVAEGFGLPRHSLYPSLALGAGEATPLEVAAAYAGLANGGRRVRPAAVSRVAGDAATHAGEAWPTQAGEARSTHAGGAATGHGTVPDERATFDGAVFDGEGAHGRSDALGASAGGARVVRPSTAYIVTDMLTAVVERGTGRAARSLLEVSAAAGKTGTSRDGWFAGYTPRLVCVVWVGYDDGSPLGLAGADSALPVWQDFLRGALELRPELGARAFARPAGVTTVEIDSETGRLASAACPHRELVAVTHALAPPAACYEHLDPLPALAASDSTGADLPPAQTFDGERATTTDPHAATPDAATRDAASSRNTAARDAAATRGVVPRTETTRGARGSGPFAQPRTAARTRVEVGRDGRARLTNDLPAFNAREQRR